jgi:hypothetical protein
VIQCNVTESVILRGRYPGGHGTLVRIKMRGYSAGTKGLGPVNKVSFCSSFMSSSVPHEIAALEEAVPVPSRHTPTVPGLSSCPSLSLPSESRFHQGRGESASSSGSDLEPPGPPVLSEVLSLSSSSSGEEQVERKDQEERRIQ